MTEVEITWGGRPELISWKDNRLVLEVGGEDTDISVNAYSLRSETSHTQPLHVRVNSYGLYVSRHGGLRLLNKNTKENRSCYRPYGTRKGLTTQVIVSWPQGALRGFDEHTVLLEIPDSYNASLALAVVELLPLLAHLEMPDGENVISANAYEAHITKRGTLWMQQAIQGFLGIAADWSLTL